MYFYLAKSAVNKKAILSDVMCLYDMSEKSAVLEGKISAFCCLPS